MMFLSKLREFLRRNPVGELITGAVVFVLATGLAMGLRFSYFYAIFVIGLFLFFDALGHIVDSKMSFSFDFKKLGKSFWIILFVFIFLTDWVGGQIIFEAWRYPQYESWINWTLLYGIIYPVGGLSVIAMYRFFEALSGKIFGELTIARQDWDGRVVSGLLHVVFYVTPLVFAGVFALFGLGLMEAIFDNRFWYPFVFWAVFLCWTFFFDALVLALGGAPVLGDFLTGKVKTIVAILVSGVLGAILHEGVNTFVYEWVYLPEKLPFLAGEFLRIPVAIIFAWIPMTIVAVSFFRFAQVLGGKKVLSFLLKEYGN